MFGYKQVTCAALMAGALALSGCAAAGDVANKGATSVLDLLKDDPNKSLRTAVDKADAVKSATFAFKGSEGGEQMEMTIKARFGATPGAEISMMNEGEPMTMLLSGSVMLIGLSPDMATGPFAGKKWLKMDLSKLTEEQTKTMELDADMFTAMFEEMNPKKQLQQMLDVAELKVVGEETIDGVKTVHYTGKASAEKFLAQLDAKERAESQKSYTAGNVKDVTFDLWVDEKYQLRKTTFKAGAVDDWTVLYSEYDTTVMTADPPAAEVADFADLASMLSGAGA